MDLDVQKLVERATGRLGAIVAELSAELAMASQVAENYQGQVAELEKTLGEKDAEIARLRQTNQLLQQHVEDDQAEGIATPA